MTILSLNWWLAQRASKQAENWIPKNRLQGAHHHAIKCSFFEALVVHRLVDSYLPAFITANAIVRSLRTVHLVFLPLFVTIFAELNKSDIRLQYIKWPLILLHKFSSSFLIFKTNGRGLIFCGTAWTAAELLFGVGTPKGNSVHVVLFCATAVKRIYRLLTNTLGVSIPVHPYLGSRKNGPGPLAWGSP